MSKLRYFPWMSLVLVAAVAAGVAYRAGEGRNQVRAEDTAEDAQDDAPVIGPPVQNPLRENTRFELVDGDRVVLLGDGLLERAGQFGYLETELTAKWPERNITFRNLGWTGDDVRGLGRTEFGSNQNTGSWMPPQDRENVQEFGFEQLLAQVRAAEPTVILVGYGAEMAAEEAPDWEAFEQGYGQLLETLGPLGARIVLVTPAPLEQLDRPGFPSIAASNERLGEAAEQIRALAAAGGYRVVELYEPLAQRMAEGEGEPLTENGVYFNAAGYRAIAGILAPQLGAAPRPWAVHVTAEGQMVTAEGTAVAETEPTEFGVRFESQAIALPSLADPSGERVLRVTGLAAGTYSLAIDGMRSATATADEWELGVSLEAGPEFEQAEALRAAVVEKNRLEFLYLHPQNKAYIFLFRRHERGDHAAEVAEFERMVARQEEEIARLREPLAHSYVLTRWHEYPEFWVPSEVETPDVAAELASFTLDEGLAVNLFAADPMLANPICMNWDEEGRLWVATSTSYPHLAPGEPPNDKIIVLEDLNGDGVADKSTVFADGLLVPHSVIPGDGGAYVTQSTELLFLKDTDGDDRADERHVLLAGFGNADVHHMIHTLRWGPAGRLYFHQSIYINSHVETPWGTRHLNAGGLWEFAPESMRLEVFSRGLVNPWGLAFDEWGQALATDGAGGGGPTYLFPGGAYVMAAEETRWLPSLNPGHPKACGLEIVSSRHFPEEWQGNLLTTDFRANRVVRYRLTDEGSGYASEQLADVMASDRVSFRPVDLKMGPDGAIYVCDWYSPIIEHGEIDFHHPLRDDAHGRIWRITYEDRPLVEPPALAGADVDTLLEALKSPEQLTRETARRLLRERPATEAEAEALSAQVMEWVIGLDRESPSYGRNQLEALWVQQGLGQVDVQLLISLVGSDDPHVRAAAVRVLRAEDDADPSLDAFLALAVEDDDARVRLEALHACRDGGTLEDAELAMRVLDRPMDLNLEFELWHVARETQDEWLPKVLAGEEVFGGDARRLAFALVALESVEYIEPLAELYRTGELPEEDRLRVLLPLAKFGGAAEQDLALAAAVESAGDAPIPAIRLLAALEEGFRARGVMPEQAERIVALLQADDATVRLHATRMAGHWRVAAARERLIELTATTESDPTLPSAAAWALAALGDAESRAALERLTGEEYATRTRAMALAAWAGIEPVAAAAPAAELLAAMSAEEDPGLLVSAFAQQSGGAEVLAEALEGKSLDRSVAAIAVRTTRMAGRDLPELIAALTAAGDIPLQGNVLGEGDMADFLADLATRGDAARGELVYRREALSCVKCHAIGGYGGQVGPDLASLGGSSPPGKLLESLLAPSATIKEGFQTVNVYTVRGTILPGVLVRQDDREVVIANAEGQQQTIPRAEIEEVVASRLSLMPEDAVASLEREELLDLVAFLGALGAEEAYRVSPRSFVRQWRALNADALPVASLEQVIAGEGEFPTLQAGSWTELISRVDGSLPLQEIPAAGANDATEETPRLGLLEFSLQVSVAGRVGLALDSPSGLWLWVDDEPSEVSDEVTLELAEGEHTVRLAVDLAGRSEPLRVELVIPPESNARADLGGAAP